MLNTQTGKQNHFLWLLLLVLLFASAMSILHLNDDVYWGDEVIALIRTGGAQYGPLPPLEIIDNLTMGTWPPTYNFILAIWGWGAAGWSEVATRMLSVFAGVLSLAFMYQLGYRLFNAKTGLIAAFLLGTSAFFIYYMHETRGYAMYVLFSLTSVYFYRELLAQRLSKQRLKVAFVISLVFLIYTHYVAMFTAVAIGLYHLFFVRRNRQWWQIMGLFVVSAIAYLPWLAIAILVTVGETQRERGMDTLAVFQATAEGFGHGLPLLFVAMLAYGLWFARERNSFFVVFWAAIFLIFALAFNFLTDYLFHVRHIIGLLPPLLLLVAIGLINFSKKYPRLVWIPIILWTVGGIINSLTFTFMENQPGALANLPIETMHTAESFLENCAQPQDVALFYIFRDEIWWQNQVLQHYLIGQPLRYARIENMDDLTVAREELIQDGYEAKMARVIGDAPRVWLITYAPLRPIEQLTTVNNYLSQSYQQCEQIWDKANLRVSFYVNEAENTTCDLVKNALADCLNATP